MRLSPANTGISTRSSCRHRSCPIVGASQLAVTCRSNVPASLHVVVGASYALLRCTFVAVRPDAILFVISGLGYEIVEFDLGVFINSVSFEIAFGLTCLFVMLADIGSILFLP